MALDELFIAGEEWRDVVGYEGWYQVSNIGRVRSVDRYIDARKNSKKKVPGKILRQTLTHEYYTHVVLRMNGHGRTANVHRLVADAFIPNPNGYDIVDHINRVRTDNRVENLRWVTFEENYLNKSDNFGTPLREAFECFERVGLNTIPPLADGETFRAIEGYDYDYYVSSLGRVVRDRCVTIDTNGRECSKASREIIATTRANGACTVNLVKNGDIIHVPISVLVATAFVDNPDGLGCVQHIDGDRTNNEASNLRWVEAACDDSTPDEDDEIWKDIVGLEGLYQVSSAGRVRSMDRYSMTSKSTLRIVMGKVLKTDKHNNGYLSICIRKDGVTKRRLIHRLVAEAFIPNPDNLPVVDHINGIRSDNRVENLRWVTSQQNTKYAIEAGRFDLEQARAALRSDECLAGYNRSYYKPVMRNDGMVYCGVRAAARDLGCPSTIITAHLRGKRRDCNGYTFEYVDENDLPEERPILQIDPDTGEVVGRYETLRSAARAVDNYGIYQCLKGTGKTAAGYKWAYAS